MEQKNLRDLGVIPVGINKDMASTVKGALNRINTELYDFAYLYVTPKFAEYIIYQIEKQLDNLREAYKQFDGTQQKYIANAGGILSGYITTLQSVTEIDPIVEKKVKQFMLTKYLKEREEKKELGQEHSIAELEDFLQKERVIEKCYSETNEGRNYKALRRAMKEQADLILERINELTTLNYESK